MRRLSTRERTLLGILLLLVAVSCYVLLFYTPMTDKRTALEAENDTLLASIQESQIKVSKKEQMEQELAQLFASNSAPASIAPYDNVRAVMVELNGILSQTKEYSLNFSTVDTEDTVVRRCVSLEYTTSTYAAAKAVLQSLHDSTYRCMLDGIDVNTTDEGVKVNAALVFFEYQQ